MNDQLKILTTVLRMSVKRNGANTPITLGHLLNICELACEFDRKIEEREEANHVAIMNAIDPLGQK